MHDIFLLENQEEDHITRARRAHHEVEKGVNHSLDKLQEQGVIGSAILG